MNCMMKKCVNPAGAGSRSGCDILGQCGCRYALERARELGGHEVHIHDNRTIQALLDAGMITVTGRSGWTATVRAVEHNGMPERAA